MTQANQPDNESLRRNCPRCSKEINAAATRCLHCWSKIGPLERGSPDAFALDPAIAAEIARREAEDMAEYMGRPRRNCPVCGREGMANATKCGYCWSSLKPLAQE